MVSNAQMSVTIEVCEYFTYVGCDDNNNNQQIQRNCNILVCMVAAFQFSLDFLVVLHLSLRFDIREEGERHDDETCIFE